MKKLSLALSVSLALAAAVALNAQTRSPSDRGSHDVTVIGCLERAPANTDAAIGTSGREPGPIFVLTKPAAEPTGTSGIEGGRQNVEYRLRTADVSDLVAQEGAKVQVIGVVEGQPKSARPGERAKRPSAAARARTIRVISIKTLSSDCSR